MLDKPEAKELLEALAAFLTNDVVPELRGRKRFHALVSANVARILARETELAAALQEREIERLTTLLGRTEGNDLPASARRRGHCPASTLEAYQGSTPRTDGARLEEHSHRRPRRPGSRSPFRA